VLKKYLIFIVIIANLVSCTKRTNIKPLLNTFSIIYINNWQSEQAPRLATFIKSEESKNPVLVIVNGDISSESKFSDMNKGLADIELMNQCKVDAVYLHSQLFKYGMQNIKDLIRKSDFSYLGANIRDKQTKQPIGQEYLFKTVGNTQIAITGINFDTLDFYLQDKNLEIRSADFSISKILPFIQERSDFQFLLTQTEDTLDLPFTMILQAPARNQVKLLNDNQKGIFIIRVGYDNLKNIMEIKRSTTSLDTIAPDPVALSILKKNESHTDSMLKTKLLANNLNDKLLKTLLIQTKTTAYLSQEPLVPLTAKSQTIDLDEIYNLLNQKNVLPIITILGKELLSIQKSISPAIKKIADNNTYSILTTIDFLTQHPEVEYDSIEFIQMTVLEMLLNNLKPME